MLAFVTRPKFGCIQASQVKTSAFDRGLIMPRCCKSVPLLERIAAKVSELHACRAAAAPRRNLANRCQHPYAWTNGPETCVFYQEEGALLG